MGSLNPFFLNLAMVIVICLLTPQVLMRVEQEQRVTEDARRFAEQDAEAQRYTAQVLQVSFRLFKAVIASDTL